ncbi:MAG: uncharacterized protein KVP18_004190 [Porospora cf. gigantea A]|nr:MAG: hypothetical protein KVP18_004190 [Porospora cf. gigantea A]
MVSSAFEKIRAQQSLDQKIAVPDVEETEDVPVEIFTKKGRRCGVCPTHLDPFELTVLCY